MASSRGHDGVWACDGCGFVYDLTPQTLREFLEGAGADLRRAVAHLGVRVDVPLAEGGWSPRQYLAHLAHWAEIIAARVGHAVANPSLRIRDLDQDHLAREHGYRLWKVAGSLERFEVAALELAGTVASLPEETWERLVEHTGLGPVPISKVAQDLAHETRHHIDDIRRARP